MKTTLSILASSLLLAACSADDGTALRSRNAGSEDPNAPPAVDPGADPAAPGAACTPGRDYLDFDKRSLVAARAKLDTGVDRGRVKPFSALETEYARVLGNTPASLKGAGTTFGQAQPRWFEEPQANAVALQAAYSIAFDGCLTYAAADPGMALAPTPTTASAACAVMAEKFWSKTAQPTEIQACADVAVTGAASDPQITRKWAYACASLLTSAGFLSY